MNVVKWLLSSPWLLMILLGILIMPTWYIELTHTDDSIMAILQNRRVKNE